MTLSIKQDNLTVAVELEEDGYEKSVSCEELLLAAYDAISRIFTQKALVKAYYNTNPDTIGAQLLNAHTFVLVNVILYTLLNNRNWKCLTFSFW